MTRKEAYESLKDIKDYLLSSPKAKTDTNYVTCIKDLISDVHYFISLV